MARRVNGRPGLWLGAVLSVLFVVLGPIAAIAETSPSDEATSNASPTVEPDGVTGPEPTGPTGPIEEPTDATEGVTGVPANDVEGQEDSVDDASVTEEESEGPTGPADASENGATEHCPDGWIDKVEGGDLNEVVLPEGTVFCVKGSTDATGRLTADGETSLSAYLGNGHDVSYYVIYVEAPQDTDASVEIRKWADVDQVSATGGDVTFMFKVKNTSSAVLTIASLEDDVFGTLSGDANCQVGTVLAAGASCSFELTEEISGDAGTSHVNVVTVNGTVEGETVSDTDAESVLFVGSQMTGSVRVTKTADVEEVAAIGGSVTFTFEVENTSSADLTIASLEDDVFGTLSGDADCQVGTVLPAGASCSFDVTETLAGTAGESHTNVVTVTGTVDGEIVADTDAETVLFVELGGGVERGIEVRKWADVEQVPASGGSVTFTFEVENTSSADLTIASLEDDVFGSLSGDADCQVGTVLAVGSSCTFELTETIAGDAGTSHVNVVTVTGTVEGETVTDTDAETVLFVEVGGGGVTPPGGGGPSGGGPGGAVLGNTVRPNALAFTGLSDGMLVALAAVAAGLLLIGAMVFALGRWLGRDTA